MLSALYSQYHAAEQTWYWPQGRIFRPKHQKKFNSISRAMLLYSSSLRLRSDVISMRRMTLLSLILWYNGLAREISDKVFVVKWNAWMMCVWPRPRVTHSLDRSWSGKNNCKLWSFGTWVGVLLVLIASYYDGHIFLVFVLLNYFIVWLCSLLTR